MTDLPPAVRLSFFPLTHAPLRRIADVIAAKRLPSHLQHTFAFDEVRQAHTWIGGNRAHGKLVVRV